MKCRSVLQVVIFYFSEAAMLKGESLGVNFERSFGYKTFGLNALIENFLSVN